MNDERQKRVFLLRVGVVGLAILILILWIFNLKNVWRAGSEAVRENSSNEWATLKADLDKTLTDAKSQLGQIKKIKEDKGEAAGNTLIADLLKETEKLASSTATAASTGTDIINGTTTGLITTTSPLMATGTKTAEIKPKNCPEYINCMPTIVETRGEARSCVIPVGCEGITQIVY